MSDDLPEVTTFSAVRIHESDDHESSPTMVRAMIHHDGHSQVVNLYLARLLSRILDCNFLTIRTGLERVKPGPATRLFNTADDRDPLNKVTNDLLPETEAGLRKARAIIAYLESAWRSRRDIPVTLLALSEQFGIPDEEVKALAEIGSHLAEGRFANAKPCLPALLRKLVDQHYRASHADRTGNASEFKSAREEVLKVVRTSNIVVPRNPGHDLGCTYGS
jgi:hypothetical protein